MERMSNRLLVAIVILIAAMAIFGTPNASAQESVCPDPAAPCMMMTPAGAKDWGPALRKNELERANALLGLSGPLPPGWAEDYKILSHIDSPTRDTFVVQDSKNSARLVIGGWGFECRSGLQPFTQRVGDYGVFFRNVATGEDIMPDTVRVYNGARPDVGRAFASLCPAVGDWTGYSTVVTGLPKPGNYWMYALWATFDGKGRIDINIQKVFLRISIGPG